MGRPRAEGGAELAREESRVLTAGELAAFEEAFDRASGMPSPFVGRTATDRVRTTQAERRAFVATLERELGL